MLCRARNRSLLIVFAFVAAAVVYGGVDIAVVPTPSMESSILVGDHVVVDKLLYGPSIGKGRFRLPAVRTPKRNDVVSFHAPGSNDVYVKRVIGVPGDTVQLRSGSFFVDGKYVGKARAGTSSHFREGEPVSLRKGMLFVLGDNRSASEDSREFGLVPTTAVIGEPVLVCWSVAIPQREWFNENGDIRTAAYLAWMTHFVSLTRWDRVGKLL